MAPGPGRRVSRAVRGLLLTPWFAASTGFVIAAGMWLYSPHASISFPSAIGTVHCQLRGCLTPGGDGSGSLASSAPGRRLPTKHRHTGQEAAGRNGAAGLRFTFAVLYHEHQSFGAIITISGKRSLGSWHLAFRLPGTQIQNVFSAEWLPLASNDGGTASPFDGTLGRLADQGGVRFQVFGTGRLTRPTDCVFDGAACTFKVTSAPKDRHPGYGGHHHGGSQGDWQSGVSSQGDWQSGSRPLSSAAGRGPAASQLGVRSR